MLRPLRIVGHMFIIYGLLSACAAGTAPGGSTIRLTEADAGRTIALRIGDRLEVTLPGNPTTGFAWEVDTLNTSIMRQIGAAEFVASSSALGSAGDIILRFEAVGAGQTELKLIYQRPFEQTTPPAQTFAVTVLVS